MIIEKHGNDEEDEADEDDEVVPSAQDAPLVSLGDYFRELDEGEAPLSAFYYRSRMDENYYYYHSLRFIVPTPKPLTTLT